MNVEYHRWWSKRLSQDMELKIYGHTGKPVIVFPTQGGRFYHFEDFGMIGACTPFIADGKIKIFTLDSIDDQAWANWEALPSERARRQTDFVYYVIQEVVPFIHDHCRTDEKILATGCSMGGYHAANIFFQHPEFFDSLLTLSAYFSLTKFIGDAMDAEIFQHLPLAYLPDQTDPWYLEQYRNSLIIICASRGSTEDEVLSDAERLGRILAEKDIPCWVDLWGNDVTHDWYWWRKQLPYFLGYMKL